MNNTSSKSYFRHFTGCWNLLQYILCGYSPLPNYEKNDNQQMNDIEQEQLISIDIPQINSENNHQYADTQYYNGNQYYDDNQYYNLTHYNIKYPVPEKCVIIEDINSYDE